METWHWISIGITVLVLLIVVTKGRVVRALCDIVEGLD